MEFLRPAKTNYYSFSIFKVELPTYRIFQLHLWQKRVKPVYARFFSLVTLFPHSQELPYVVSSFLHSDIIVSMNPLHYKEDPRSSVGSKLSNYSGFL